MGTDVLLGQDIPFINQLLKPLVDERSKKEIPICSVQTRKEIVKQQQQIADDDQASAQSDATVIPWHQLVGLDTDMVVPTKHKIKMSQSQKRQEAHRWANDQQADGGDDLKQKTVMDAADSSNIDAVDTSHVYTDVNKLIREQKQDPTMQSVRQEAGEGGTSYVYQDGVLYRHSTDQLQNDVLQLLLPQARRNTAIRVAHTVPMAGHLGFECTKYRLLQHFYWPTLTRYVREASKSSPQCQKAAKRPSSKAPLILLPIMAEPFARVAIDMVGPLTRTKSRKQIHPDIDGLWQPDPEAIHWRIQAHEQWLLPWWIYSLNWEFQKKSSPTRGRISFPNWCKSSTSSWESSQ